MISTLHPRYRGSPAVGQLWVQTANIARKAGHLQTSYSAVLQASELNAPTAFLQKAKLLKQEDQPHKAIAELEANLPHCTPKDASIGNLSDISTRDYGKVSLPTPLRCWWYVADIPRGIGRPLYNASGGCTR